MNYAGLLAKYRTDSGDYNTSDSNVLLLLQTAQQFAEGVLTPYPATSVSATVLASTSSIVIQPAATIYKVQSTTTLTVGTVDPLTGLPSTVAVPSFSAINVLMQPEFNKKYPVVNAATSAYFTTLECTYLPATSTLQLSCIVPEDLTLSIFGDFNAYLITATTGTDSNIWTENLLMAEMLICCAQEIREGSRRNSAGMKDWLNQIDILARLIRTKLINGTLQGSLDLS
jgi:hypothetical protein